jgi:pre-mRNA-splicing factor RBM22/SLT11
MSVQKWEDGEKEGFPIVCEPCLGTNPYMRMLKEGLGRECKVCGRPFTIYKWSPGDGRRWKKTEICVTCSKIKNACQCCVLDLDYHIHTMSRDTTLEVHDAIPMSDVNAQVYVRKMEAEVYPLDCRLETQRSLTTEKLNQQPKKSSRNSVKEHQLHTSKEQKQCYVRSM